MKPLFVARPDRTAADRVFHVLCAVVFVVSFAAYVLRFRQSSTLIIVSVVFLFMLRYLFETMLSQTSIRVFNDHIEVHHRFIPLHEITGFAGFVPFDETLTLYCGAKKIGGLRAPLADGHQSSIAEVAAFLRDQEIQEVFLDGRNPVPTPFGIRIRRSAGFVGFLWSLVLLPLLFMGIAVWQHADRSTIFSCFLGVVLFGLVASGFQINRSRGSAIIETQGICIRALFGADVHVPYSSICAAKRVMSSKWGAKQRNSPGFDLILVYTDTADRTGKFLVRDNADGYEALASALTYMGIQIEDGNEGSR